MIAEEIERAAMKAARMNFPDPPNDLLDGFLYLSFYSLYSMLYAGQISREQARPIKNKLLSQYNHQKVSYDFDMKLRRSAVKLWHRTETACNAYALNRTLENADQLWTAVLNLPERSMPKNAG